MRWEDERYVRVYTRDTADWLALSFDAQSLMALLLRKIDRAGLLALGKQGKKAVAIVLSQVALWETRIAPALEELLVDGCVQIRGEHLIVPNFIEAQEATQSEAQRKRESRARARDQAAAAALLEDPAKVPSSRNVTAAERNVTPESHSVTTGHSVPSRAVPSRADPDRSRGENGAMTPGGASPAPRPAPLHLQGTCPRLGELLTRLNFVVEVGRKATDWSEADGLVEELGLDDAFELATEAAPRSRTPDRVPLRFLMAVWREAAENEDRQPTPPKRKPGELPKVGDPDFNDYRAWGADVGAFQRRTDGKTWEEATGLKKPVYVPPKSFVEEEAAKRAAAAGAGKADS